MKDILDNIIIAGVFGLFAGLILYWQYKVMKQLKTKWAKYIYVLLMAITLVIGGYAFILFLPANN